MGSNTSIRESQAQTSQDLARRVDDTLRTIDAKLGGGWRVDVVTLRGLWVVSSTFPLRVTFPFTPQAVVLGGIFNVAMPRTPIGAAVQIEWVATGSNAILVTALNGATTSQTYEVTLVAYGK